MMKNKNFAFSSIILFFLTAVIYFRCSQEVIYIPSSFMSCRLEKKLTGIEARQWVNKIHGKVVTPPESEIGFYLGENGPITVYVSGYQTAEPARKELLRMTEKISSQNSVFIGGKFVELDGKNIYRCFGMGQTHFVFTHHNKLIWFSVNTIQEKEMLRAYLDLIN